MGLLHPADVSRRTLVSLSECHVEHDAFIDVGVGRAALMIVSQACIIPMSIA